MERAITFDKKMITDVITDGEPRVMLMPQPSILEYAIGDTFWVRESWTSVRINGQLAACYESDGEIRLINQTGGIESPIKNYRHDDKMPWALPRSMPRLYSRFTLEITNIHTMSVRGLANQAGYVHLHVHPLWDTHYITALTFTTTKRG